jgi:hypothetical protein
LYASPNIIIRVKGTHRAEMRNAYKIFVGKREGKRSLGRLRRGWEDVDWMRVAEDRDQRRAFVYTAMKLLVP